jgi:hypothetical protein
VLAARSSLQRRGQGATQTFPLLTPRQNAQWALLATQTDPSPVTSTQSASSRQPPQPNKPPQKGLPLLARTQTQSPPLPLPLQAVASMSPDAQKSWPAVQVPARRARQVSFPFFPLQTPEQHWLSRLHGLPAVRQGPRPCSRRGGRAAWPGRRRQGLAAPGGGHRLCDQIESLVFHDTPQTRIDGRS